MEIKTVNWHDWGDNPYRVKKLWWKLYDYVTLNDEIVHKILTSFQSSEGHEPEYIICMPDIQTLVAGPTNKRKGAGRPCDVTSVDEKTEDTDGKSLPAEM